MSIDILKEKLKNRDTAGLYYFYGEEEYLKRYYYEQLRKKTADGFSEFNITEPSGEQLDLNAFENIVNSFPMMSDKKFVGISDLRHDLLTDQYKKGLSSVLKDLPEYLCLVFMDTAQKNGSDAVLQKIIEKAGGVAVRFDRPTPGALASWGKRHFQSLGKKISGENMQYILRIADNDMLSLKNEIVKIAAFAKGEQVQRADIDAVITKSLETNRFALSDAVSKRDFRAALLLIGDLYAQDYDDIQIVNLIYRCICDLLRANWALAGGVSREQFAKDFGLNPYGAGKMMRATKALGERTLMRSAELCLECEKRLKGEAADKKALVYDLIGRLMGCDTRL